ncbi:DNA-binding protein [Martelella alba]|uniref:DNA-binding transcriptional regulator n=1 Tax=Martelella alba TaxID=2590451 RepID=A0ABY2SQX5_9HYPH|nr:DNA-binding protein [Martelella alba]TKI08582.1 putative DNA-binding transcriptional regulator [Martelella alba]
MANKREWVATHELIGVGGLPKTRQGLNRRAREEGWQKRRREGARGKAVEYSWQSLPETVKKTLTLRSASPEYTLSAQEPSSTWMEIHRQLSDAERDFVVAFILREGVLNLLKRLDYPDEFLAEAHRD